MSVSQEDRDAELRSAVNGGIWLYRTVLAAMVGLLVLLGQKGCEFRDDTRDRLTRIEHKLDRTTEFEAEIREFQHHVNDIIEKRTESWRDVYQRLYELESREKLRDEKKGR